MPKSLLKAIIFDFDGVLVESVSIKSDAFRILFGKYPQYLDDFIRYHEYHGGVSRFVKIRYFFKQYLNQEISDPELANWCQKYSQLVVEKVVSARFVKGTKNLLDYCLDNFDLFVVSGTPQDELREIVERRSMANYFLGVYGSPTNKQNLVENILQQNQFKPNHVLLIGDALTDYEAACAHRIPCIIRCENQVPSWVSKGGNVSTCSDMVEVLNFISLNFKKEERIHG